MSSSAKAVDERLPRNAEEVRGLLIRAEAGDATTLPVLRRFLRDSQTVTTLGGDLARLAERSLVSALTGENLAMREAILRKLELMREELAGPAPSPLERLLIERVVACWLQVQEADARYAQARGLTCKQLDDYQRRMDRSHRRYLAALKSLALVRKLALPVLQVNIAREQVNLIGGG